MSEKEGRREAVDRLTKRILDHASPEMARALTGGASSTVDHETARAWAEGVARDRDDHGHTRSSDEYRREAAERRRQR